MNQLSLKKKGKTNHVDYSGADNMGDDDSEDSGLDIQRINSNDEDKMKNNLADVPENLKMMPHLQLSLNKILQESDEKETNRMSTGTHTNNIKSLA